jgi:hypothetical protein
MRYPGGLIATTPVNQQYPSGVWTGPQTTPYQANNVWANDSSFKNTTLLLHGDGATTSFTKDASTNNFQLSLAGDTKPNNLTPFVANGYWSNYFDAFTNYLSIAAQSALTFAGDFTIEAWVYLNSVSSYASIIEARSGINSTPFVFGIYNLSGYKLDFFYGSGRVTSASTVPLNQFTHVAVSRSGSTIRLFINGTLDANTATVAGTITPGGTTQYIGALLDGNGYNLNGYISNLRVVKGTAVYTSSFTPSTTPLTAITNTSLLICQSNRFIDNSSNAYAITVTGSPVVSMQQPFTAPSGTSQYGSGYFDGSGDWITTPNVSAFDLSSSSTDFTIEAWVYNTGGGEYRGIIGARQNTVAHGWCLYIGTNNTFYMGSVIVGNSYADRQMNTTVIPPNSWAHIALVKTSSGYTGYVNGVGGTLLALTGGLQYQPTQPVIVGALGSQGEYPFFGSISNVRVVKGTALYTSNFTPSTAPFTPVTNTSLLTLQTNGPENNNGFLDSSLNNFPITRNGNTTQGAFSPYGTNWSNYFDGSSHLTTASSTSLQAGTGAFTLEGWINVTGSTSGSILSQIPDVNSGYGVGIGYEAGSNLLTGVITTTSTSAWVASITPVKGVWYHMAFVRDASTNIALFINGVKITPTTGGSTNTTNINTATTFVSGSRFYDNPTRAGFRLTGYVSNARFVKGSAVYDPTAASITVPTLQLTAVTNTQLLILQANRIYDGSSNAFAITYSGTQNVGRFSPFQAGLQYGTQPVGGSGYFDGSGDYLSAPDSDAFWIQGDFTFEAWVYQVASKNVVVIAQWPISGTTSFIFRIDATAKLSFAYQLSGGSGTNGTASTSTITYNTWNHVVWTRSGTTFKYFINGVQDATTQTVSGVFNNGTGVVNIGLYNTGVDSYFNGYITDTRFVNGTALYSSNFTPPTTPLPVVAQTSLLCNFTNAAIFDNSGMSNLETVGNAQIDTSVVKYGTSSMYFDGSGDYLDAPTSVGFGFGTGNYTVEFWIYLNSLPGSKYTVIDFRASAGATPHTIYVTSSGYFGFYNGSADVTSSSQQITARGWYHVAYSRGSGILNIYVSGVSAYSAANTIDYGSSKRIRIGGSIDGSAGSEALNGYLDDLRITQGVARYVTNFTPPVARMPNQ